MSLKNKPVVQTDLNELINTTQDETCKMLRVAMIGKIKSYNSTLQTATVQVLSTLVSDADGSLSDYPALLDCPVVVLQGGGGVLQFPISSGDQCLVIFNDRNIDSWFETGSAQPPASSRCHDLSDGMVIVGLNPASNPLTAPPAATARFKYSGAGVDLTTGLVKIYNATTTLLTVLNGLITVIEGLQVNGPLPLTAASIAALEAYKAVLATLLL